VGNGLPIAVSGWVPFTEQSQARINLQFLPTKFQLVGRWFGGDDLALIRNGIKSGSASLLEACGKLLVLP
jgi:hypothetical protein